MLISVVFEMVGPQHYPNPPNCNILVEPGIPLIRVGDGGNPLHVCTLKCMGFLGFLTTARGTLLLSDAVHIIKVTRILSFICLTPV